MTPPPLDASADADPGTPQRPPVGQAALEAWLAQAFHQAWTCEDRISPTADRQSRAAQDLFQPGAAVQHQRGLPGGAASVKELYTTGDQPNGFAVGVKVEEGAGAYTWYWYERRGTSPSARPLAEGVGVPDCAVCHGTAPRDNVFISAAN